MLRQERFSFKRAPQLSNGYRGYFFHPHIMADMMRFFRSLLLRIHSAYSTKIRGLGFSLSTVWVLDFFCVHF